MFCACMFLGGRGWPGENLGLTVGCAQAESVAPPHLSPRGRGRPRSGRVRGRAGDRDRVGRTPHPAAARRPSPARGEGYETPDAQQKGPPARGWKPAASPSFHQARARLCPSQPCSEDESSSPLNIACADAVPWAARDDPSARRLADRSRLARTEPRPPVCATRT